MPDSGSQAGARAASGTTVLAGLLYTANRFKSMGYGFLQRRFARAAYRRRQLHQGRLLASYGYGYICDAGRIFCSGLALKYGMARGERGRPGHPAGLALAVSGVR